MTFILTLACLVIGVVVAGGPPSKLSHHHRASFTSLYHHRPSTTGGYAFAPSLPINRDDTLAAIKIIRGGGEEGKIEEGGGAFSNNVITITSLPQIQTILNIESDEQDSNNRRTKLVVLDFASNNCPPCDMIKPYYDELSLLEEFQNNVIFCKVNISDHPEVATQYNIDTWPTFVLFRNGEIVDKVVGGMASREGLYDLILQHSSS
jgi:thioredoxin 1